MLRHFRLPIVEAFPRAVVPDFVGGAQHRARVGDGSSADRAAVQDGHVAKEAHVEEAAKRNSGTPEPAVHLPAGFRQVFRSPAAAYFHDADAIALLGKTESRDASTEAGTNDDEIEVEFVWIERHVGLESRFCSSLRCEQLALPSGAALPLLWPPAPPRDAAYRDGCNGSACQGRSGKRCGSPIHHQSCRQLRPFVLRRSAGGMENGSER